jgi:hypothetical protein
MSAYIDLNPVRAGIVKDPADYRWSGYAEAAAGRKPARLGLKKVVMGVLASECPGETARQGKRRARRCGVCWPDTVFICSKTERNAKRAPTEWERAAGWELGR